MNFFKLGRLLASSLLGLSISSCFNTQPTETIEQSVQGQYTAALSKNGKYSLVASVHHGASFWNLEKKERIYNWNHTPGEYSHIDHVSLSSSGNVGITNIQKNLVMWSSKTGKPLDYWKVDAPVTCIDQNARGSLALIGMESGEAIVIDVKQKGFLHKIQYKHAITACALDDSKGLLALGSAAGALTLYSFKTLPSTKKTTQPVQSPIPSPTIKMNLNFDSSISHINISASNGLLLVAAQHDKYQLLDLKSQKVLFEQALKNASLSSSLFRKKEDVLLGFSDRRIEVLQLEDYKVSQTLRIPKKNIWKPQGVYIQALGSSKGKILATSSDGLTLVF